MKKKLTLILLLLVIFTVTSCKQDTTDQDEKSDYLAWKSNLVEMDNFSNSDELICDIVVSVSRVSDEVISYTTVVSNPKEDMHDVKMMVVHNYFTEEIFPTVGVFDEARDIIANSEGNSINLVGYIDTTKDIKKLDLELKIWIEYTDNNGEVKDIYYKTTK